MLKKISIIALLPLLCFAQARANMDGCCDSQWNVYADWLYWKPRCQSLDFATPLDSVTGVQIGDVRNVKPSYQSGFRVGLLYECDDLFGDFFYTRFHHNYSNSVTSSDTTLFVSTRLGANILSADSASISASWSFDYDTVDLLVGSEIHNPCSCFKTRFFGGLKLVFIDQKFNSNFINIDDGVARAFAISEKNKLDGYGVDFGMGMHYDFWRCLNFFTRVSGDIFLAKFHRTFENVEEVLATGISTVEIDLEDNYWNMVSALNVMFGLGYDYRFTGCWCGTLGIAVGYEFHQYFGISDWLAPLDENNGAIRRNLQNLSLDGLFVRVSLGF